MAAQSASIADVTPSYDSEDETPDDPGGGAGHVVGFERPSLLQDLRNILAEYPDDGQIFKEMIQNAEDAGATVVQIFSVWHVEAGRKAGSNEVAFTTCTSGDQRPDSWRPDFVRVFSSSGLCVYNDAKFTKDDWAGIKKLHDSVKAKDPLKVGRFGLGFKSVFHITDHPVIISGHNILFMNPFEDENKAIYEMALGSLIPEENRSLNQALMGVSRVLPKRSLTEKRFSGTLFWFPLRQVPSDLSGTLYSQEKVRQLKHALRLEVSVLPLFLKRIEKIEVYSCGGEPNSAPVLDFSASLTKDCLQATREERKKFISAITTKNKQCPAEQVAMTVYTVVETCVMDRGSPHKSTDHWMVVNFHHGLDNMSSELSTLCQRHYLTHRPYVGMAIKLNSQTESFQGQVFCFLPLPMEKVSPTGLPVHVNGFFELSTNRRQIKWPSSGQEAESGEGAGSAMSDDALLWNQLLVSEVLPHAYVTLVKELISIGSRESGIHFSKATSQAPYQGCEPPDLVYSICPNPDRVNYHWQPLLKSFYREFAAGEFFFTHVMGGYWTNLKDAVLMLPCEETGETKAAIVKVYGECEKNLVQLPVYLTDGLAAAGILPKDVTSLKRDDAATTHCEVVCPEHLSNLLKADVRWHALPSEDKRLILHYFCRHTDTRLLEGLELLPLVNGKFSRMCTDRDDIVYVCRDSRDVQLLPGLQHRLCFVTQPEGLQEHLVQLAHNGFSGLKVVDTESIPSLLQESMSTRFSRLGGICLAKTDGWIRQVWRYLQDQSLAEYIHLPLLPCIHGDQLALRPLRGNYVCKMLPGFPSASSALSRALGHLGVTVINGLPDFVLGHSEVLHHLVQPASYIGLIKCLAVINTGDLPASRADETADRFNRLAEDDERNALVHTLSMEVLDQPKDTDTYWTATSDLLHRLRLFPVWPHLKGSNAKWGGQKQPEIHKTDFISVAEKDRMTPKDWGPGIPLPTSFAPRLLDCSEIFHRRLAIRLGAQETQVTGIIQEVLSAVLAGSPTSSSKDEIIQFMSFFLQSSDFAVTELRALAGKIRFVPSSQSYELKKPGELYDPRDSLMQELFLQEDRFPDESFCRQNTSVLASLKRLGLRDVKKVLPSDLVQTARYIEQLCGDNVNKEAALRKSKALWKNLERYGGDLGQMTLEELARYRCLPCVSEESQRPQDYPQSLPLCPELYRQLPIARPRDMIEHSLLHIVASVCPVALGNPPQLFLGHPSAENILAHLTEVISKFSRQKLRPFSSTLCQIYTHLQQLSTASREDVHTKLSGMQCILNERDGVFHRPSEFWVEEHATDLDLRPYRFLLPTSLMNEGLGEFFMACGCHHRQNSAMLNDVLQEIRHMYGETPRNKTDYGKDMKLVVNILKALHTSGDFEPGKVLLPVYTTEKHSLVMRPAAECTVAPDPQTIELLSEEEGLVFLHPDLHKHKDIAVALGAIDLRSRTLTGVDNLDLEDEEYGQQESLTTRLRNLLQEGYTDGFSVPKELLQNADDAGATVVKLLLDERENPDWRSGLITPELSSLQGPAIWAYNDAMFTDTDFANICKLGGATKKEDTSKVGRFGLGFNAVYNLTEVPTLYSGTTMAMLDPHEKYLEGKRGKKMNFNHLMNKVLLKRMPNQFRPFQRIFGCDILNKDYGPFTGTLFRFPLRTEEQASRSEICKEAFSKHKREEFVDSLLSRAGNLMLFVQHVQRVELYHMSKDCTDPSRATRLLVVKRSSESDFRIQTPDQSILRYFSSRWRDSVERGAPPASECVLEQVTVTVTIERDTKGKSLAQTDKKECRFHVAWATGAHEACKVARGRQEEGFVPLAAVAVPVDCEGKVLPIKECPDEFYPTGHLFCFLPLPREASESILPVHINAPFALTSDRRRLLTQNEDDTTQLLGAVWNKALFSDAIPRAYLTALQNQENKEQNNFAIYYSIWPTSFSQGIQRQKFHALFTNYFYTLLVTGNHRVFAHSGGWVNFSSACFFDPDFKETPVGKVAFQVLEMFWQERKHDRVLVDLPYHIVHNIQLAGKGSALQQQVISEVAFFTEFFFPWLRSDSELCLDACSRDQLVLHALLSQKQELQNLVINHACIPSRPHGILKRPSQLVHPQRAAAPLFTENDERFPQKGDIADFCSNEALDKLVLLGMVADRLRQEEVVERAHSVERIAVTSMETAAQRAMALVHYLSPHNLGEDLLPVKQSLSKVKFLPVLKKPADWLFQWCGNDDNFVAPSDAFGSSLKELVACEAYIINDQRFGQNTTLEDLGVTLFGFSKSTRLVHFVMDQLLTVSRSAPDELSQQMKRAVESITKKIYKFLNAVCDERRKRGEHIPEKFTCLQEEAVVWTKFGFQSAHKVAFDCKPDCTPYLIKLDSHSGNIGRAFFQELGVKQRFDVEDALCALEQIRTDKGSSQLTEEDINLVINVASLLSKILEKDKKQNLDETQARHVHLPDRRGWLHPVSELCLDDCDWVTESESMRFLHSKVSAHLAQVFNVRTKREHDEDDFTEAFGQHEQLTNRINRLLEGYKRDSTIFKELLQNADDAGATEVRFVKDLRRKYSDEKLLNDNWKELMGPALCVYNDACFTQKDMKGIQDLGQGSKEDDVLKTGKYGVGFNAVYNLTDTPCFWTRVDGEKETVCVLDPNFFVAKRSKLPGMLVKVSERFQSEYPNMLAPFVINGQDSTKQQNGTVFRLPIRTQKMAKRSQIKQKAVDPAELGRILREFQPQMGECLLFLNNVRKIGVYSVQQDGSVLKEYETELTSDERNAALRRDFNKHVRREAVKLKAEGHGHSLSDFQPGEVALHTQLTDTQGTEEEWLVVNKFGLEQTKPLIHEATGDVHRHRLLPLGGIAVCVSSNRPHAVPASREQVRKYSTRRQFPSMYSSGKYPGWELQGPSQSENADQNQRAFQAYCTLPLPVCTGLPVHVNGRFALDHETRRNIDTKPNTLLASWNFLLASHLIVPAYIRALEKAKQTLFSREQVSLTPLPKHHVKEGRGHACEEYSEKKRMEDTMASIPGQNTPEEGERGCKGYGTLKQKLQVFNSLFPEYPGDVDTFWRQLMKEFYMQVAHKQAEIFPVKRKDLQRLLFVPAVRSEGFPGYFWDLDDSYLKKVLLRLNMNIIKSPFRIHEAFRDSGVRSVRCVAEETVIEFLKSCRQEALVSDSSCNLKDLPKSLQDTSFQNPMEVDKVLEFISDKVESLDGLPLSLRESGKLYVFHSAERTIVSLFADLLPGSSDLFLMRNLIRYTKGRENQTVLEKLNIRKLASLLPDSLDRSFGSGVICEMTDVADMEQMLPNARWIRRIWEFLERELPQHDLRNWQAVDSRIDCLSAWSLVPVRAEGLSVQLFPLKLRNRVVHLHDCAQLLQRQSLTNTGVSFHNTDTVSEERNVIESLKKLPVNRLDLTTLSQDSAATSVVASVIHPRALLNALTQVDVKDSKFDRRDAETVLDFFQRKLPEMSDADVRVARSLPFFERPDGSLTRVPEYAQVLCLPECIPTDGLNEWVESTGIILFKSNKNLRKLHSRLGFQTPNALDFYTDHLVPRIRNLPAEAIPVHMKYIRDHLVRPPTGRGLIEKLQQTAFIKGTDSTFCKASNFYSPYLDVFQAMLTKDLFPPAPYDTPDWRSFLESIGMICQVSANHFLQFARQVEDGGKNSITETIQTQSRVLCEYFFQTRPLWEDTHFLQNLNGLRFLLPKPVTELKNGNVLERIHLQFPSLTKLLTFTEGCSPLDAHIAWTSQALLLEHADPKTRGFLEKLYQYIGFVGRPSEEVVLKHIRNVCLALRSKGKGQEDRMFLEEHLNLIETISKTFYTVLNGYTDEILKSLRDIPIIFHTAEKAVFLADQVVITLTEKQKVLGHVVKAPEKFGQFFSLFRRLGVSEEPRAEHYAKALEQLHEESGGKEVNPNELELVKSSVDNLFTFLKSEQKSEDILSVGSLYLPAEYITLAKDVPDTFPTVRLTDSRQLILEVTDQQKKRVRSRIEGLAVFLGFEKLALEPRDLHRDVNLLLPETYRMKLWQDVVKETLTEPCRTLAHDDIETRFFEERLHSPEILNAVLRLVNHQRLKEHAEFPEEDAGKVETELHALRIRKVSNLTTVLTMHGEELPNTRQETDFFLDSEQRIPASFGIETVARVTTLYVDSRQDLNQNCTNHLFIHQLSTAVRQVVGTLDPILDCCLRDPSRAAQYLDGQNVPEFHIRRQAVPTVFPPLGSPVPKSMYELLDNDVYAFQPGEYVAFEVYDPCLQNFSNNAGGEAHVTSGVKDDFQLEEDENTARDAETEYQDSETAERREPHFIFAKVVTVINPSDQSAEVRARLLRMRYSVNIGEEELKEVGACELYKFIRPKFKEDATSSALVPFTGEQTSLFSDSSADEDLAKALKDVRRQLRDIWAAFSGDKERMRAVKRLLMKWHPDKNQGREEFCTEVFQRIQHYVNLLHRGQGLPSDDEDTVDSAHYSDDFRYYHTSSPPKKRRRRHGGGFYSSFFRTVFDFGRSYASSSSWGSASFGNDVYSTSTSGSHDFYRTSTSNPSPEEGGRWMRQAKHDLEAARLTLHQGGRMLSSWACYQAHQTAEKALKAVMFRRDAWSCNRLSHDICALADSFHDQDISCSARKLDSVVGYHTRVRYPLPSNYPEIPAELYGMEEANKACELADQIIHRAQILFQQEPPQPPPQPAPSPSPSTSYTSVSYSSDSSYRELTSSSQSSHRQLTYSSSSSGSSSRSIAAPQRLALPPPP